MNVTLRPATLADASLILEFIEGLADYAHLRDECVATEAQIQATLFGEKPAAECLLAFQGDEPAGFALYFTNYSTFLAKPGLYLEDLFVKPAFRKHGIGRALLVYLANLANQRGYGRMDWSVLEWNKPAIEFYQRLGAKQMEDFRIFRLTGKALAKSVEIDPTPRLGSAFRIQRHCGFEPSGAAGSKLPHAKVAKDAKFRSSNLRAQLSRAVLLRFRVRLCVLCDLGVRHLGLGAFSDPAARPCIRKREVCAHLTPLPQKIVMVTVQFFTKLCWSQSLCAASAQQPENLLSITLP